MRQPIILIIPISFKKTSTLFLSVLSVIREIREIREIRGIFSCASQNLIVPLHRSL
jgi:hypothetical protein